MLFDDAALPLRVQQALAAVGIESRPLWKPMHAQPVFAGCRARVNGISDRLAAHGMCLPSGSVLTDDDVRWVVDELRKAL